MELDLALVFMCLAGLGVQFNIMNTVRAMLAFVSTTLPMMLCLRLMQIMI